MRLKIVAAGLVSLVTATLACSDDSTTTIPILTGTAGTGAAGTGAAGTGEAGTGAAGTGEAGTGAAGTGAAGTGAAGTGAAGTGAAGTGAAMPFMAITPCNSAGAYVAGTAVAVGDATQIGYTPACLKVAPGTTVTIGASMFHPLSARSGGSSGNPIGAHQTAAQTLTFPTAGFYPFQCDVHFSLGMMGVIWVSP